MDTVLPPSSDNKRLPKAELPMKWKDLPYWKSGEYQVVQENLRDLSKKKIGWCPGRRNLFSALDLCPFGNVKCVLVGQDPYPNPAFATGVAFSIPKECKDIPPTLAMILKELKDDLGFYPQNGDLTKWCANGVLLWNAIPSCTVGKSKSHHWPEWELLTEQILTSLAKTRPMVVVLLGSTAHQYDKYLKDYSETVSIIYTSHPSPRGNINTHKSPFLGSRLFSTINKELVELGQKTINWELP